ncbi:NADH-quinone oxidoreductase subunit E [Mameliella sediminis]|uniref:NADH-quinone oxidoreductase subunit E n=1 Tax=Mameliella sediminis TaxID=2836866 RepID=UPI001C439385|nr:NADH-quinone oxidoreductase subunit E [Mameliella sediminis]MBV7393523.1 NADH-quinone oxidoreductase subunit E [Mameliella sediminis]MBY6115507.1 NADH-quinone oxidoreductase subunit E [Antarctobacter heliothermus]MBY6145754.1 NADH-quinone oxidoreductase subunit E [Mameliella alba]MCA0954829.1 NADH-quinone oxidoreductase subunit E [Mameliella alba]
MLRRLHPEQPDSFAFTPANMAWAREQITKYPEGRQASAIIPLLWRAQEQEGWLSRPAIEAVADMLGMAYIRALEVASFYFMFQLQPVGSVAHIQICGTTSCMICGAEDLISVCREKIADKPHVVSADGKFSWEEVECLGSCTNAPMAQIGKDYYEDLTVESLRNLLDALAKGEVPQVGPQNGRFASEPKSGITTLTEFVNGSIKLNASAQLAHDIGDTVKRIDGTEVPLLAPWNDQSGTRGQQPEAPEADVPAEAKPEPIPEPVAEAPAAVEQALIQPSSPLAGEAELATRKGSWKYEAPAAEKAPAAEPAEPTDADKPAGLSAPREGKADDLKRIKGVGPKLEQMLHGMGVFHFDQIAIWTEKELAWVDDNLEGFKGRASRDEWIAQAKDFAAED